MGRAQELKRERIADRYWSDADGARAYLNALEHIARMPDENDMKKGRGLMRNTRWEGIGPAAVLGAPNRYWHGRMRTMRWYRNPVTGSLETYLGASSGGLWIGNFAVLVRVWTSLGDNLPNPAVGAFLIDSLDPNTIWVGTGDWRRYAGSGLYKTTDRGGSWQRVPLTDDDIVPTAITGLEYGTSRSIMYLSSNLGFFRSTDAGTTWRRVGPATSFRSSTESMVVDPTNRARLFAAVVDPFGLYRSTDAGLTWVRQSDSIRKSPQSVVMAMAPSSPNTLYAALSDRIGNVGTIYRTTNGGERWDSTPTPPEYLHSRQAFNNHAIAVHPTDPNRVYVGGVGLMRTTDGGNTWAMRTDGHTDITGIFFPPSGGNSVMILNDGGIFTHNDETNITTNVGEGFTPSAPLQAYSLEDAWSNSKVMVSGTQDNGTIVTDEAGRNSQIWWLAGGCDGGNSISIDPSNPAVFYFNSWCGPSYRLRSKDMGRTQEHINQGLPFFRYVPIRMNKLNTNMLFTVTPTHLFYSSDGGDTWLRATSRTVDDFDTTRESVRHMMVNHHSNGPLTVYVWFNWNRDGIARSVRMFRGTPGEMTVSQIDLPSARFPAIHHIAADRWSANIAYALTDRAPEDLLDRLAPAKVFRTTDAGVSWTDITGNLPNINSWDVVASPTDSNTMWIATDLGVFKTRNGGVTWYRFQHGLPIVAANAFSYIRGEGHDTLRVATFGRGYWHRVLDGDDPIVQPRVNIGNVSLRDLTLLGPASTPLHRDTFVVIGGEGIIGSSTDGGRGFRFDAFPSRPDLISIASSDPSHVTAVGAGGTIIHSATGAREWTQVASGTTATLRGIAFSGPTGWIIGEEGIILRTTNSGGAWTRLRTETNAVLIGMSFPSATNGWVVGGRRDPQTNTVMPIQLRTNDGGLTWIEWQAPPAIFTAIEMVDDTRGYATGLNGVFYTTSDGGSTWTGKPTGEQTSLTDLVVLGPQTVYVTTLSGRILYTNDDGKSWTRQEDVQAPGALYAIERGTQELMSVGDSSVFLMRYGAPAPIDTAGNPEFITNFAAGIAGEATALSARIESIVPNPTSSETSIRFSIARPSRVTITVHSLVGSAVATLPEQRLSAGSHSAEWDGRDDSGRLVPSGAYVVRIATERGVSTARVSVVR